MTVYSWSTPLTWENFNADGMFMTGARFDPDLRLNPLYLKSKFDTLDTGDPSNVTASRALDTQYTNSGTKALLVQVTIYGRHYAAGAYDHICNAYYGASAASTLIANCTHTTLYWSGSGAIPMVYWTLTFVVPPSWKYKAKGYNTSGDYALSKWCETEMF